MEMEVKFVNQLEATRIQADLFNEFHFSVEQITELCGLSCAQAINKEYDSLKYKNVLVCCGNGHNGAYGLVCARNLALMDYNATVFYPQKPNVPLFRNFIHQNCQMCIDFLSGYPNMSEASSYDLIVDAVYGFSFKAPVTCSGILDLLDYLYATECPVVSIDIPSGWDVEDGPADALDIKPDMLVSLTSPKLCAKKFKGKHHYLGGRFVPKELNKKFELNLPNYPGLDLCVKL